MLVDPVINGVVARGSPFAFSLDLDRAEEWLMKMAIL